MTWNDLVRVYWPEADDTVADFVLWNMTSFPMGGLRHVVGCLETWRATYKTARGLMRYGAPRNERMLWAVMEKYATSKEAE
jgi:hypothetical protein